MSNMLLDEPQFDLRRVLLDDSFHHLAVAEATDTQPLRVVLAEDAVSRDTAVLVINVNGTAVALLPHHLVYHNVMHGTTDGTPWVASFCAICNGGACFSPQVSGKTLSFKPRGLYNAMMFMADAETESYWDHITGQCMHGEHCGAALPRLSSLLHMTVEQALTNHPDVQLVIPHLSGEVDQQARAIDTFRRDTKPEWQTAVEQTLSAEDTRLPRLEMGLGIWTDSTRRYYPMTRLHTHDNIVLDEVDGRQMLIYIDPHSHNPHALFTTATGAVWRGDVLRLDNGESVRAGVLHNADGSPVKAERPFQLLQRWYGFALTFPGCEIYEG